MSVFVVVVIICNSNVELVVYANFDLQSKKKNTHKIIEETFAHLFEAFLPNRLWIQFDSLLGAVWHVHNAPHVESSQSQSTHDSLFKSKSCFLFSCCFLFVVSG